MLFRCPPCVFLLSRQILHTWVGMLYPSQSARRSAFRSDVPLCHGIRPHSTSLWNCWSRHRALIPTLCYRKICPSYYPELQQKCLMSRGRALRFHVFLDAYQGPPTKMACRSQVTDLPFLHPKQHNSKRADMNESRGVLQQATI